MLKNCLRKTHMRRGVLTESSSAAPHNFQARKMYFDVNMQNFKSYLEESDENDNKRLVNKLLKAYKDNKRREEYYLEKVDAKVRSGTLTVEIVKTSKGYGDTDSSEKTYEFSYTSEKGGGYVSSKKVFLDKDVLEFLGLRKLQPRYFGDRAVCFDKYADYGIADPVFKKMIIKVKTYFD